MDEKHPTGNWSKGSDSSLYFITNWLWRWKSFSRVRLFVTPGLCSPWNSPGQDTGVGSLSLLQGIFQTQGSNPGLPHCRWILNHLSHHWSPNILEWLAYPFSSRSSRPRNRTGVSCIGGGFFINWATRGAHFFNSLISNSIIWTFVCLLLLSATIFYYHTILFLCMPVIFLKSMLDSVYK